MRRRRLVVLLALTGVLGVSFVLGQLSGLHSARAAANRVFKLREGDRVTIPLINQVCTVSGEAGSPDLFCARARNPRHQVVFFRDEIIVWRNGNPDKPAWSGRP